MADSLYTQREFAQFRGPTTSDDYNERMQNWYQDMVTLYNKAGLAEDDAHRFVQRMIKQQFSLSQQLESLDERIAALEAAENKISFFSATQIDNDRFNGTAYEVLEANRCYHDLRHGLVTLPKIESSSMSKLYFTNSDGSTVLPSNFEAIVVGTPTTADTVAAVIDTSDVYHAVLLESGRIWERNVIVNTPDSDGAELRVYFRLPNDVAVNPKSNCILIHPYPIMGVTLKEVAISLDADPNLNDTDNYEPLNSTAMHTANTDAVGWLPPGGWDGDEIEECGPKAFYFDPQDVTAVRVTLQQDNYFRETSSYIYTYGMSKFDVRYEKFLDEGKMIVRFDAPDGETISSVTDLTAEFWNVSVAEQAYVYDYRLIWETSYNSGSYTLDSVPLSQRVWVEITLDKTINSGTPALSSLSLTYT